MRPREELSSCAASEHPLTMRAVSEIRRANGLPRTAASISEIYEREYHGTLTAHPEYRRGGAAASLLYPEAQDFEVPQRLARSSNGRQPMANRSRLLTPHAREAAALAHERRAAQAGMAEEQHGGDPADPSNSKHALGQTRSHYDYWSAADGEESAVDPHEQHGLLPSNVIAKPSRACEQRQRRHHLHETPLIAAGSRQRHESTGWQLPPHVYGHKAAGSSGGGGEEASSLLYPGKGAPSGKDCACVVGDGPSGKEAPSGKDAPSIPYTPSCMTRVLAQTSLLRPQPFSPRTPSSLECSHHTPHLNTNLIKLDADHRPLHGHLCLEEHEPPPSESPSGLERQQQEVVAGLRTQVAALTSLLEHGVRVPPIEQPSLRTSAALHVWFGATEGSAVHTWQWKGG